LLFQIGTMILKVPFIPKGHILSKGLCFKIIFNFEGTLNRKGTMVLRTLLIPKGQKKGDEEKKDLST
jgi:hypothetical protein